MANKVTLNLTQEERAKRDKNGKPILVGEHGHYDIEKCYKVRSTRNTIDFSIGQYLSENDTRILCNAEGYEVNITQLK